MNHPNTTASGSEKIPLDIIDYFLKIARNKTTEEKNIVLFGSSYDMLLDENAYSAWSLGIDDGRIGLARSFLDLYVPNWKEMK